MKRMMCGGFLLASFVGLGACSGDPTGDLVGSGIQVQSTPTSLFMPVGEEKAVVVTVLDAQGNEQDIAGFSFQAGAGVTAREDTTYLRTSTGGQLGTSRRLFIQGVDPTGTSVSISANGQTLTVPVRVTPISTTVTLSTAAPAANEPLVITLPPGYKFGSGAGASLAGAAGAVQAVAPDSSSVTVLLPPGATGTVTVDSVQVDYAPGVLFSLPTTETVTVGAVTPLAGTGSPGTAPAITIAPVGGTTLFFDGGTFDYVAPTQFGDAPARLYSFTVTEPTTLTTSVDWPSPEDLGLYFFDASGTTEFADFVADVGFGGEHPEAATNTFEPGTYTMAVVNWNATNPPYFALNVTTEELVTEE